MKILVIDDEASMRELIEETIRDSFNLEEVLKASHGAEALLMGLDKEFDLVICDYQMPVMNGLEYLRILRRLQGPNQFIPLIFLSGFVPVIKDSAVVYEDVYFVDKPFHGERFVKLVSMIIKMPLRKSI